jgi:hypothetical protein
VGSPFSAITVLVLVLPLSASAQQPSDAAAQSPANQPAANVPPDKRMFGVLTNYRTADLSTPFAPITPKEKFTIAAKDSFDWPVFITSGLFACLYQLENSNPSFGQGLKGYAKRYATSYGDQMIGNFMTEGVWPTLLKEDPRYFRRGAGPIKGRLWYAATRIFVTRTDAGKWRFNYSEVVGNSVAVAIANAYYPDSRDASDNVERLGIQLATDSFSNVLKEFWPDIKRRLSKHSTPN